MPIRGLRPMNIAARLARASLMLLGGCAVSGSQPAVGQEPLAGVNIAGGEFNSARKPGTYGQDYIYPDAKTAQPFVDMGMQLVRVPILWERLQPIPLKPLEATELALIDKALVSLSPFQTIILDIHNYGKFNGQGLDQIPEGGDWLSDLWQRLADHYKGRPAIAFGLMNEPNGMTPAAWRKMVDHSVAAIRQTGARNLILVPGSNWTGAHSWTNGGTGSNAAAFSDFRDPGSNYAFEMHQYLDANSSGTVMSCVDPATVASRMASATNWLRSYGHRGFLGEFGAPPDQNCLHGLDALLKYLSANGDAWMGWTYWAGGAWWGSNYPMSVQPIKGQQRPQAAVLTPYIVAGKP
jgi:endoglucanase